MLHVRLVVPDHLEVEVRSALDGEPIVNVVWNLQVVQRPNGSLVLFDVPSESANRVIGKLRALQLHEHGSITVDRMLTTLSATADAVEAEIPGDPSEAVFWEEVKERVADEAALTVTWTLLVVLAVLIASVGLLTDSSVLIVGAMAVGPEFGPVAAIAIGFHVRRHAWVSRGLVDLGVGFGLALLAAFAMTWLIERVGLTPRGFLNGETPQTDFVRDAGFFSGLVACFAGIAGMLSLTLSKSSTLVGVLISVTTVPAAAGVAVYGAHGKWIEARGSAFQLLLNLCVLAATGVATLAVQRKVERRRMRGLGEES